MRLIGLLSWYAEPAWALTELVGSLARAGVDHLVAVDGAYALYPEARARSDSEQAHALVAAAEMTGIGLSVHAPQDIWIGNEIEKRSFLFAAGHVVAEPGEDWLWVADGDEIVTEALGVKHALEAVEEDVAEVLLLESSPVTGADGIFPIRKLFRAQASGIRVERNHFRYVTGDGRVFWNGDYHPLDFELEPAANLHMVRVRHRPRQRDATRLAARDRYYKVRGELGIEVTR